MVVLCSLLVSTIRKGVSQGNAIYQLGFSHIFIGNKNMAVGPNNSHQRY